MKGIHLARRVAKMAWAKKAEDVVIIDVRGLTETTDFFVISTGNVGMHVRAITDFVMDEARGLGERANVSERDSDEWMVVDFVDVIFHCFQPQKRRHYNLERLWCEGLRLELNPDTGVPGTLKAARVDLEQRRLARPPKPVKPAKVKPIKLARPAKPTRTSKAGASAKPTARRVAKPGKAASPARQAKTGAPARKRERPKS